MNDGILYGPPRDRDKMIRHDMCTDSVDKLSLPSFGTLVIKRWRRQGQSDNWPEDVY